MHWCWDTFIRFYSMKNIIAKTSDLIQKVGDLLWLFCGHLPPLSTPAETFAPDTRRSVASLVDLWIAYWFQPLLFMISDPIKLTYQLIFEIILATHCCFLYPTYDVSSTSTLSEFLLTKELSVTSGSILEFSRDKQLIKKVWKLTWPSSLFMIVLLS